MTSNSGEPRRIKVQDKRRVGRSEGTGVDAAGPAADPASVNAKPGAEAVSPDEGVEAPGSAAASVSSPESPVDEGHDYLDDLRRLQAEFDNYRKRMMREQTALTARATERLVERLLPVLDNFERALAHGAAVEGVELVFRQLADVLAQEGLEEIPAEGVSFDPSVHEAVEVTEQDDVVEATSTSVLRRGYRIGGRLLRPAMVTVARPPETPNAPDGEGDAERSAVGEG